MDKIFTGENRCDAPGIREGNYQFANHERDQTALSREYMMNKIRIHVLTGLWDEYTLIDSGNTRKLERIGPYIIDREEPKAWWVPDRPKEIWAQSAAVQSRNGHWKLRKGTPREWIVGFKSLVAEVKLTDTSRHVGIFPEQSPHWEWLMKKTAADVSGSKNLLNLFGYTGMATLAAVSAGYDVTHVDASKPAMLWARRNAELSDLGHARIRWILDDASKFVAREVRRRSDYHGIVMDPPSFGRGPKGEIWKAEKKLNELMMECRKLLEYRGEFLLITVYNLDISALSLSNLMKDTFHGLGGVIDVGELALQQEGGDKILPRSIYARWERS